MSQILDKGMRRHTIWRQQISIYLTLAFLVKTTQHSKILSVNLHAYYLGLHLSITHRFHSDNTCFSKTTSYICICNIKPAKQKQKTTMKRPYPLPFPVRSIVSIIHFLRICKACCLEGHAIFTIYGCRKHTACLPLTKMIKGQKRHILTLYPLKQLDDKLYLFFKEIWNPKPDYV